MRKDERKKKFDCLSFYIFEFILFITMKKTEKNIIYLLGIGAFLYLGISSFILTIEYAFRDLFIYLGISPNNNFWFSKTIGLLLFGTILIFSIKTIVNSIENTKVYKIFLLLFCSFFIIQFLQFLYTYFITNYIFEKNIDKTKLYYNEITIALYSSYFTTIKYLVFGSIILLTVRKK